MCLCVCVAYNRRVYEYEKQVNWQYKWLNMVMIGNLDLDCGYRDKVKSQDGFGFNLRFCAVLVLFCCFLFCFFVSICGCVLCLIMAMLNG